MPCLADASQCTGCSACFNSCGKNAISMEESPEGFLFPKINQNLCVNCGQCEKKCPVVNSTVGTESYIPSVYAMWSIPDREKSSSGGAFSAFARYVLDRKGTVFGAAYDENFNLRHVAVDTLDGLDALRGSKYIQSRIGDTFKQVKAALLDDRYVLFCGTPCQVDGLKKFLTKDYERLITLDLACHGAPSNKVFKSYLDKLEKRLFAHKNGLRISQFEFRRREGWGYAPTVIANDGKNVPLYGIDALYMEAFNACAIFRESCYSCKYSSLSRVGDCSIADFWGIGRHGIPFNHDVLKGVSLLMVNTEKGGRVVDVLDEVFMEQRSLEEALCENHNLKKTSPKHEKRNAIIKDFVDATIPLEEINKRYHIVDMSLKAVMKRTASKLGLFNVAKRAYNWYRIRTQDRND